VESEQVENNSEVMNTSNTQLLAIENKIDVKRKEIISFAEEHEITSLERDENRLLIKVKALSANLDQAISEKTAAQALLNSLVDSVQKNQSIIRDEDKAGINATKQRLQLLTRELSSLEQKYTQAYLERDPIIVNKQQTVTVLEKSLFEQLKSSQKLYLQDTERDLTAANEKVLQMQLQFEVQNQQAQIFSQKLQEYKILNTELTALQEQEQKIRNQQVSQEVSQPFDAKISVLEAPYTPNFPSGPDYWFISLISLLVAFVSSVIALLLFGYVVKQKYVPQASTNYMVVPGQSLDNGLSQLSGADQVQLAQNSPTLSIGSETSPNEILRELTEVESKALYSVSNSESKVIIGLVYAGLNIDELCQLERSHFSEGYSTVSIQTGSKRILELSQHLSENIALFCQDNSELTSFWSTIDKVEDLEQVVINTAYDVELENPEQFSLNVLRHTYICYLVRSGVRLNDLNKIVGKVSPSDLAKYRPFQRVGSSIDFETINLHYPLHKQVK
ncbi:hypothetical protein, partial [Paraglaciecola sp.]|uniref:hypothetical protein n=1 Tax=Paraglaciecola sp. TaxID=1920173 RepID=UPI003EF954C8